ncbi:MAG: electron transfer flavoprotein subunit alpha/FixB family protein [Alphaproteobacteria bacterium]|nr:Electron transfer flavoprotein subunit alpha [Pseudorhodoplanes sp.]MCQ3941817.1 electron transfer flavoprotein subunit alpha/FixB family protein [Alphaproteobacteria bacterium]GIK81400.1 MAG: electron transfer flavoprotein subunit beta [Alphaproteobacteria bacterium]
MSVLLLAEHDNAKTTDATARALSAALQTGKPVDILVAGENCHPAAEAAAALSGVARVILVEDAAYKHGLAEVLADLIVQLGAQHYQTFVAAGTALGKSVMPRVAALFDVMQVTDVSRVVSPTSFERLIYAGNAIQLVEVPQGKTVLTVRVSSFEPVKVGGSAPIETAAAGPAFPRTRFVGESVQQTGRPELTSARVVVSGGRGMGSADNFDALIKPIADRLGAAIGASRAAVDSGFAPNDLQVGQTGKAVAPELYIAVGISGAIQHLAGMKDSKVIVAINKDEEAPIFQIADYGLVGDLFTVLPDLDRALQQQNRVT